MNKTFRQIDFISILDLMKNIEYGSNSINLHNVTYIERYVKLGNIVDKNSMELVKLTQDGYEVSYVLIYKNKSTAAPVFTFEEFFIEEMIGECVNEPGKLIEFKARKELFKYCRSLAKSAGIGFAGTEFGCSFYSKAKKEKSAYKIITEAVFEGLEELEFDSIKYNAHSVRCYAAQVAASTGRKISVSVSPGSILVKIPVEKTKKDEIIGMFSKLSKIEAVEIISELNELYMFEVEPAQPEIIKVDVGFGVPDWENNDWGDDFDKDFTPPQ